MRFRIFCFAFLGTLSVEICNAQLVSNGSFDNVSNENHELRDSLGQCFQLNESGWYVLGREGVAPAIVKSPTNSHCDSDSLTSDTIRSVNFCAEVQAGPMEGPSAGGNFMLVRKTDEILRKGNWYLIELDILIRQYPGIPSFPGLDVSLFHSVSSINDGLFEHQFSTSDTNTVNTSLLSSEILSDALLLGTGDRRTGCWFRDAIVFKARTDMRYVSLGVWRGISDEWSDLAIPCLVDNVSITHYEW